MAKYLGRIDICLDATVIAPVLIIKFVLPDGRKGTLRQPLGDSLEPMDDVTLEVLQWNVSVAKRISARMFLVLLAALLARTHPSALHAAGVGTPEPGWVSLKSLVALPPFAGMKGRAPERSIMKLAAGRFMAKGPMTVRTPRDPVVSFEVDPERVTFGEKALEAAQRALKPCAEKRGGSLTLEEMLKLSDDALIPYLRGGVVALTSILLGLLADPKRLDKKAGEWLRVIRPLIPHVLRWHVYLGICQPIDHKTIEQWLAALAKKKRDDEN